jgi:hypothetical protein
VGKEHDRCDGIVETRHSPEQIITKFACGRPSPREGQEVAVVAKQVEVSEQTLQGWGRSTAA